jgi:hypothetical protein
MRFWLACILLTSFIFLTGCDVWGAALAPSAQPQPAAEVAAAPPPEPTPTPLPSMIVSILGNYLLNVDPIDRVLETKFEVMDATYGPDETGAVVLAITVNCDGLCCRERTFAMTIQALKVNLEVLSGMIPPEVTDLQVITLDQFQPSGTVFANWQDVLEYCGGIITDTQLAGRISRP